MINQRTARRTARRTAGTILICVLTCLLVTMSLVATSIHITLRARRECKLALQVLQTELLLDAGFSRALSQIRHSPKYRGEVWHPADDVLELGTATVEIRVEPHSTDSTNDSQNELSKSDADMLRITVVARLENSIETTDAIQRSHTLVTQLSNLSLVE